MNFRRIEVSDVVLDDLNTSVVEGFTGNIHTIRLEVPKTYLEKTEPGPLFGFNLKDHDLFEFYLGVKRGRVLEFYDDKALVEVELGSEYLRINLSDLQRVKNAVLITPNT